MGCDICGKDLIINDAVAPAKGYAVDPNQKWLYPPRHMPPMGVKLILLTVGGVTIIGDWDWYGGFVGFQRNFKSDKVEEAEAIQYIKDRNK